MPVSLHRHLFPQTMRSVPQRRLWLNLLRALHILSVGIVIGGLYFSVDVAQLHGWISAMVLSGLGMLLIDLYASCFMLFEVRGVSMVIKLLMVLCLPLLEHDAQLLMLMTLLVLSALASHSRRRLRHHCLLPPHLAARFRPDDLRGAEAGPT